MIRLGDNLRGLAADERGVAAIEMALVGSLLVAAVMNVVEVSRYAYVSTQVAAATQAAAQAAIIECPTSATPVTTNCTGLDHAVAVAIEGTSLGDEVSLKGSLSEGWYCLTGKSGLQKMSNAGSPPGDCSGAGLAGDKPGLYLRVATTYAYEPIFPGLTITEAFPKAIVRTAWMRTL